ncbi:epoxide hydrolase N-terminal domain-containing protein [Niabella defluvii]|nr:epoxide hydrolase N-terminal domain-containing protein [Niabella sp. I65]
MKPFTVNIPQTVITDLKNRIQNTRWPGEPEGAGWQLGTSEQYLKELAQYWVNGYSWEKYEKQLNQYPQYITEIDGVQIHFQYIKGKGTMPGRYCSHMDGRTAIIVFTKLSRCLLKETKVSTS